MAATYTAPEDVPVSISHDTMQDGVIVEQKPNGSYEKMNMGHWLVMDSDGNTVEIPTQCGWRNNPTALARAYADQTRDIAMSQGFVPIAACPHTTSYTQRLHGDSAAPVRLVPVRNDAGEIVTDEKQLSNEKLGELLRCNGSKDGCVHWHAERTRRLAASRALYDSKYLKDNKIDLADFERIASAMSKLSNAPKGPRG